MVGYMLIAAQYGRVQNVDIKFVSEQRRHTHTILTISD